MRLWKGKGKISVGESEAIVWGLSTACTAHQAGTSPTQPQGLRKARLGGRESDAPLIFPKGRAFPAAGIL